MVINHFTNEKLADFANLWAFGKGKWIFYGWKTLNSYSILNSHLAVN